MSLSHSLVTLNQTAQILTVSESEEVAYSRELTISIQNLDTQKYVYLGSSSVTTSSYGYRIDPGQTWVADLNPRDEVYAVTSNGTSQVAVIKVGS